MNRPKADFFGDMFFKSCLRKDKNSVFDVYLVCYVILQLTLRQEEVPELCPLRRIFLECIWFWLLHTCNSAKYDCGNLLYIPE